MCGAIPESLPMRTRANIRVAVSRSLWTTWIWPLVAGAVAAIGVSAASNVFGWLVLCVVYAVTSLFAVATVWGLSTEIGIEPSAVVRWGLYAALVLLVTVGLSDIHPLYGLLAGVAVVLTSPAALRLLARVRPRTRRRGVAHSLPSSAVCCPCSWQHAATLRLHPIRACRARSCG